MMSNRIVIVGCGAAGWAAAFSARKTARKSEVIVLEEGSYPMYERGGIPYVIQGEIADFERLIILPTRHYQMMGIDLRTDTKVTQVDPSKQEVTVVNNNGQKTEIKYDALVLSTGAQPFLVPIPGHALPGVYGVRTLEDGMEIRKRCETAKSAVVVGARLVGLEMAVALRRKGLAVTVIELLPQILDGILDPEVAPEVQQSLENSGLRFILGTGISEILGNDHVEAIRAGLHTIETDLVIMATGVRARTQLAEQMGVELGETNLIKVNDRMETSILGVFAAGDCVECVHAMTRKPAISQLGTNAIRQGKVAGTNAAGGSMVYPKILGACITLLEDMEVASTGLTETWAKKLGIECLSASIKAPARSPCYPEQLPVRVKLVARKTDGRLIGAQIACQKEVGPRIDAISLAIANGASVDDLILFDHAYSPPVADSTDPLSVAAEALDKRLAEKAP